MVTPLVVTLFIFALLVALWIMYSAKNEYKHNYKELRKKYDDLREIYSRKHNEERERYSRKSEPTPVKEQSIEDIIVHFKKLNVFGIKKDDNGNTCISYLIHNGETRSCNWSARLTDEAHRELCRIFKESVAKDA